jgi:hypothetical protein
MKRDGKNKSVWKFRLLAGRVLLPSILLWWTAGCTFLLPTSQGIDRSKWNSYPEAQAAFDRIVPGVTDTNDLVELGFHFSANPNARLLTYLDVIARFMPNRVISKKSLDPAVREFIEAGDEGQAWEINLNRTKGRRQGNALLDITGFKKITHETGWKFNTILLVRDGFVVYKLASGIPNVNVDQRRIRPLGPFQEMDELIIKSEEGDRRRSSRDSPVSKTLIDSPNNRSPK